MKKVLLIAGGGTLGMYTARELLELGHQVDVICLEDHVSDREELRFFKEYATLEFLEGLFRENRYNGVVNFLHYKALEDYIPYHKLISANTDHMIFLSSYRVYANLQSPITETAPQLIDVVRDDPEFLEKETYAVPKSRAERFLAQGDHPRNWTIVRPVISFSHRRLDLCLTSGTVVVKLTQKGRPVRLPEQCRKLTAGLDWAGNSGKLIANLLFKEAALGEAFTVSTAQNLTWEQVAALYTKHLGAQFQWEHMEFAKELWPWHYDRAYDRKVDNSKILEVTGLTPGDFTSIEEGICIELEKLGAYKR